LRESAEEPKNRVTIFARLDDQQKKERDDINAQQSENADLKQ